MRIQAKKILGWVGGILTSLAIVCTGTAYTVNYISERAVFVNTTSKTNSDLPALREEFRAGMKEVWSAINNLSLILIRQHIADSVKALDENIKQKTSEETFRKNVVENLKSCPK